MGFRRPEQGLPFWGPGTLLTTRFTCQGAFACETGGGPLRYFHFNEIAFHKKESRMYNIKMVGDGFFQLMHHLTFRVSL